MATIASGTVGPSNQYNICINADLVSQNINNNTSVVVVKAYVQRNDGYSASAYNLNGNVYRYTKKDWGEESGYNGNIDTRNNALVLVKETSYTVYHDAAGNATPSFQAGCAYVASSLPAWSLSGSMTLPTIPRASTPTASNGTIGSSVPISIARASNSFTHTLKATFGGTTDTIATGVGTSYNWTPALSLQNRIPSATSGNCVITCETYSGGTLIGTKTVTISLAINTASCTPTVTGSYADLNTAITAITGSATLLVSSLSNAQITAVPSLKYGATLSSIKIGGTNVIAGGSPYRRTIEDVTAASYLLEVTDSRGLSNTYTLNLTYATYQAITFLASFFRTAAMNNEIALQFSGTFYNNNIGTSANTLTVRYRYQPELGEWSNWTTVSTTITGNNFANVGEQLVLGDGFDHNKQYRFEIEFIDLLDVKTNTILVRAGRHILRVTETAQVLQGKLHIQKLYTKNDKDFVFDFVYDVITRTWLVHVYSLTQMFEPQHIFQSDVNTRSIITVLNVEGYPLLKYTIDDTANNFIDYENVDSEAVYNNYTLIDTGICPLENMLEKRARELQFTVFNTSADQLSFYVSTYIDSRNVSNPEENSIDWISDPEDPDYGQLYEIEEEVANVYGETTLDEWVIDYSQFPKTGLVKSHLQLHGKGLYYRAIIVNRDKKVHELSGITWVYRIMNVR